MKLNSLLCNPMGQTLDKDSRNAPNEPSGGSGAADPSAIGDDTVPDSNQTLEFGAVIPQHEMGSSPAEPSVRISNPFGRYEIERCLEVNSGGQVYLARDGTLGRHVTIIVPNCEEDSPNSSVKLIESAKIAARLRHPNLRSVFDVGQINGIDFISTAHVPGRTLDELIRHDEIPLDRALVLVRKIALALDEIHRNGLVHGNLNPSNVVINRRGDPVIIDYWYGDQPRRNLPQGDWEFRSPEQLSSRHSTGRHSDVFSLGLLAYCMLVGKYPFEADDDASAADNILNTAPDPPSKLRPSLSEAIDRICLRAMSRDPQDRYRSMAAFAKDLRTLITEQAKSKRSQDDDESDAETYDQQGNVGETTWPVNVAFSPASDRRDRARAAKPARLVTLVTMIAIVGLSIAAFRRLNWRADQDRVVAQSGRQETTTQTGRSAGAIGVDGRSLLGSQPIRSPKSAADAAMDPVTLGAEEPTASKIDESTASEKNDPRDDSALRPAKEQLPASNKSDAASADPTPPRPRIIKSNLGNDPDAEIVIDGQPADWDFSLAVSDPGSDTTNGDSTRDFEQVAAFHSADSLYVAATTAARPALDRGTFWIEIDLNGDNDAEIQLGESVGGKYHYWARGDDAKMTRRMVQGIEFAVGEIAEFRIPWKLIREQFADYQKALVPANQPPPQVKARWIAVMPADNSWPDVTPFFPSRLLPLTPFPKATEALQWESIWVHDPQMKWELDANLSTEELESKLESMPRKGLYPYSLSGYISQSGHARYAVYWMKDLRTVAQFAIPLADLDQAFNQAEKDHLRPIFVDAWSQKPLFNIIFVRDRRRLQLSVLHSDSSTINADIDRKRIQDETLCGITGWYDGERIRFVSVYSNTRWQGLGWRHENVRDFQQQIAKQQLKRTLYIDTFRVRDQIECVNIRDENSHSLPVRRFQSTTSLARFRALVSEMQSAGFRPLCVAVTK